MSRAVLPAHGRDQHRCNGPDGIPVLIHLAISTDLGERRFVATDDLGGTYIRSVHATLGVPGSTATTVAVENETNADDLLTTDVTIDSSETSSYDAATQHVVDRSGDPQVNYVQRGDVFHVTATLGTGADELTVLLEFGPDKISLTP